MPDYRRAFAPGGTFFFTLVTYERRPIFQEESARRHLREAMRLCRAERPFEIDAMVLLPEHLHAIWTLPDGDADFSARWSIIKRTFTQSWLGDGGTERAVSPSRRANHRRGIWRRRFWEHLIRDENDYNLHADYIHYNPVKHGLVSCPHAWGYSTFGQWRDAGRYEVDWMCACDDRVVKPPEFERLNQTAME
jgi:putative transposase